MFKISLLFKKENNLLIFPQKVILKNIVNDFKNIMEKHFKFNDKITSQVMKSHKSISNLGFMKRFCFKANSSFSTLEKTLETIDQHKKTIESLLKQFGSINFVNLTEYEPKLISLFEYLKEQEKNEKNYAQDFNEEEILKMFDSDKGKIIIYLNRKINYMDRNLKEDKAKIEKLEKENNIFIINFGLNFYCQLWNVFQEIKIKEFNLVSNKFYLLQSSNPKEKEFLNHLLNTYQISKTEINLIGKLIKERNETTHLFFIDDAEFYMSLLQRIEVQKKLKIGEKEIQILNKIFQELKNVKDCKLWY